MESTEQMKSPPVRPMGARILIRQVEADTKTKGGLFIPDSAQEKPTEGIVLAIGKGRVLNDGTVLPIDLQLGDRVLFNKYTGTQIQYDGTEYIILDENHVVGVMDKAA